MAKYYGAVGFMDTQETRPGIWTEEIVERNYCGDIIHNIRRQDPVQNEVNDKINVQNQISIVMDPYANEHFFNIRYVTWQGAKWKVSSVEVQYPRLVLSVGGVYNGEE